MCILRAWTEEGSTVVRVEISTNSDVASGTQHRVVMTGVESVDELVHEWLREVTASTDPSQKDPT